MTSWSPATRAVLMPPHRKGPSAKASFRPAFLLASRYPLYIPAASRPRAAASRFFLHPRKNPAAAISLMSPPPKPPGTRRSAKIIGRLTLTSPRSRSPGAASGNTKRERPETANRQNIYLSGICMDKRSVTAILIRMQSHRKIKRPSAVKENRHMHIMAAKHTRSAVANFSFTIY